MIKKMISYILLLLLLLLLFPLPQVFALEMEITAYDWMSADQKWIDGLGNQKVYVDGIPVIDGETVVPPMVTMQDLRSYFTSKSRYIKKIRSNQALFREIDRRVNIVPVSAVDFAYEINRSCIFNLYDESCPAFGQLGEHEGKQWWVDLFTETGLKVSRFENSSFIYTRNFAKNLRYLNNHFSQVGCFNFKKIGD